MDRNQEKFRFIKQRTGKLTDRERAIAQLKMFLRYIEAGAIITEMHEYAGGDSSGYDTQGFSIEVSTTAKIRAAVGKDQLINTIKVLELISTENFLMTKAKMGSLAQRVTPPAGDFEVGTYKVVYFTQFVFGGQMHHAHAEWLLASYPELVKVEYADREEFRSSESGRL